MKAIGHTPEEIKEATNEVTNAESYEDAQTIIKKYWK